MAYLPTFGHNKYVPQKTKTATLAQLLIPFIMYAQYHKNIRGRFRKKLKHLNFLPKNYPLF